jgi:asparagine synthase (glutamine-hydrolysing)
MVRDQGPRLDKYLQSFDIPMEDYYFSKTSTPYNFFNADRRALYTDEMSARVDSELRDDPLAELWQKTEGQAFLNRMLYVDTKTWLPDDLLVKADKMTMAMSLELRVPLLDHRVLEFAARLPTRRKLRGFETKHLLKSALEAQVPEEIRKRKKTGFPVPYERWLAEASLGPIRDLLLDRVTIDRGYFQPETVATMLERHAMRRDLSKEIFSLVVLELWHRLFADDEPLSSVTLD